MGSKGFKNKTCVYCGRETVSETADHVVAREFFRVGERANLPKVPACNVCNNAKSQLEHYVLAVLPMGGVHPDAVATIVEQVARRIGRNEKLRRNLAVGQRDRLVRGPDGVWREGMSIPFEGGKLATLACYIALGLAWHHWKIQIAPNAVANASIFTSEGTQVFESAWAGIPAEQRVTQIYESDVIAYRGGYIATNRNVTLWQMRFFGGVELGDSKRPGETTRTMFVATNDAAEWIAKHKDRPPGCLAPISVG
ncbi:HNH endonuclease [Burkholderia gladioli]|uniref:HNH endonuclease n=1 Tax=Burkholderia gladioli TaxID=28095 RepID=UPI00164199F9|nr:HNH endonuclease [Burkholderia gladioli]